MRPVNLLPENLRPRETTGGSTRSYIVLAILAALLLATGAYVVTVNQVTDRQAQAAKLKVEAEQANARAGALAAFGDFRQVKETRMESVKMLSSMRMDWERTTRELARLLPAGVWLTDFKATSTGQDPGGSSGSATGSSTGSTASSGSAASQQQQQGPRLSLVGCASNQEAVAETMVRLRRLSQAQDVSLVSSEQPPQQAGGTASPAGGAQPAGSGPGRPQGCGTKGKRLNYRFEINVVLAPNATPPVNGRDVPRWLGGGA